MRVRKKSAVVEAVQWTGDSPLPKGCFYGQGEYWDLAVCFIRIPEGDVPVHVGDWIITDEKGERSVCEPDIFEATYEAVEEDAMLLHLEQERKKVAAANIADSLGFEPTSGGLPLP